MIGEDYLKMEYINPKSIFNKQFFVSFLFGYLLTILSKVFKGSTKVIQITFWGDTFGWFNSIEHKSIIFIIKSMAYPTIAFLEIFILLKQFVKLES